MGEERKVSYYRYYERLRRAKKRIEELESENEKLKHAVELGSAYKALFLMMLRYIFDPNSITPEKVKTYHEAIKTVIEKEKDEKTKGYIVPKVTEMLEKRLKIIKAPQK